MDVQHIIADEPDIIVELISKFLMLVLRGQCGVLLTNKHESRTSSSLSRLLQPLSLMMTLQPAGSNAGTGEHMQGQPHRQVLFWKPQLAKYWPARPPAD